MKWNMARRLVDELLQIAGITINGNQPWDLQIHNDRFYNRVLNDSALGLGESYMEAWWDCPRLDEFLFRIVHADLPAKLKKINTRL